MRELLSIDIKKLKEEDRRFLLNKSLTETIASYHGSMHNTLMNFSLLALFLAGFSLVYQTRTFLIIGTYTLFGVLGLIFYLSEYKKHQHNLTRERAQIKINYNKLFKLHFAYTNKEKK